MVEGGSHAMLMESQVDLMQVYTVRLSLFFRHVLLVRVRVWEP